MATPYFRIQSKIAEIRHEILSYKPGNGLRFDDKGAKCPHKLVIGLVDLGQFGSSTASALRRALHGGEALESQNYSDELHASSDIMSEEQEEYLTNTISVLSSSISCRRM